MPDHPLLAGYRGMPQPGHPAESCVCPGTHQKRCWRKDMEILSTTMTVRLESMLMFGLGLLLAVPKLT